jgi:hypothetical protein
MQLSKSDALLLSKVLFHYEKLTRYDGDISGEFEGLFDIIDRLSEFLTGLPAETPVSASPPPGEHDDSNDEDNADDGEDEDVPVAEQKILAAELHDLPSLEVEMSNMVVSLEFEEVDSDGESAVDLLLGDGVVENVNLLRRNGKVLEIWADDSSDDLWHESFEVKKLSKAWKLALKDGVVYEVS